MEGSHKTDVQHVISFHTFQNANLYKTSNNDQSQPAKAIIWNDDITNLNTNRKQ